MLCSRFDFDQKFRDGELNIAFIGMSNIGKSHRSRQLAEVFEFDVHNIDVVMAENLGVTDEKELAEWMGYPFDDKFEETQSTYLDWEHKLTQSPPIPEDNNFILDTTGSVIYLNPTVHQYLKDNFLIVQLDAPESMLKEMEEEFFVSPKPIVWKDLFSKHPGESDLSALRRCYPGLLQDRIHRYRTLADIVIPGEVSRSKEIGPERFWEILRLSLPA